MQFSGNLSNLVSCNCALQRTHYWIPKTQDGWDPPSWTSTWRHFFCWGWSDLDKMLETGAEWHVDCSDVVEIETRCRIPIWWTFGRIQWHVIPKPPATLQGAATWRIQCRDSKATCHIAGCCCRVNSTACHHRATYHIAGCCYLVNSLSRFQSHMPHCRVQSPGEINVMIVPHYRV